MIDYETPPHLFRYACKRLNFYPELDVCADADTTKCPAWIDIKTDAFKVSWNKNFFMNPRFNDSDHPLGDWVQRASDQAFDNSVSGLLLLPCYTDSNWWQKCIGDKMQYVKDFFFLSTRIKFLVNGEPTKNKYQMPCCFVLI